MALFNKPDMPVVRMRHAARSLSCGVAAVSLLMAPAANAQSDSAADLERALRACRLSGTAAASETIDPECQRQLDAMAAVIRGVLAEQQRGPDDDEWRVARLAAQRLVGRAGAVTGQPTVPSPAVGAAPASPPPQPRQPPPLDNADRQALEPRRQDEPPPRDPEAGRRMDAIARTFRPLLSSQTQSDNLAWAASYGAAYQLVDLIDVAHSRVNVPANVKGRCVDAVVARLVANEVQKYGSDPVLGMLRYMSEYVHKFSVRLVTDTPQFVTLGKDALLVNPYQYAPETPMFGPIVTSRFDSEQTTSQASVSRLKPMMGKYWDTVDASKGWGNAVEVKQLTDYRDAVARKWHAPTVLASASAARPLEVSACLAFPK